MSPYLIVICAVVVAFSLVSSFVMIRRQQNRELDEGLNKTTTKHPILANPILIMYVLFPIFVVLGSALLFYFYW